jgi:hypothetical protein
MPKGKKSITKLAQKLNGEAQWPKAQREAEAPKRIYPLSNFKHKSKSFKVTRNEAARIKALDQIGMTPYRISKITGRARNTIANVLNSQVYKDPHFEKKIELIKEKELLDLYQIGGRARHHLTNLLEAGSLTPLETIAAMDRSFQQRRLLEGKSTENIASLTKIIEAAHAETMPEADRKMKNIDQYTEAEIIKDEPDKG